MNTLGNHIMICIITLTTKRRTSFSSYRPASCLINFTGLSSISNRSHCQEQMLIFNTNEAAPFVYTCPDGDINIYKCNALCMLPSSCYVIRLIDLKNSNL